MYAPPNLGRDYGERFKAIYPDLARKYDVPLYPFFLEGVALDPKLNQGDGMHPNAQGVAVMVRGILPYVTPLLARQG
jgi:acyl-CoA thioesterase-1